MPKSMKESTKHLGPHVLAEPVKQLKAAVVKGAKAVADELSKGYRVVGGGKK